VYSCPNSNPTTTSLRSDISSNAGGRGLICSPGRCLYLRRFTACWVLVQQWRGAVATVLEGTMIFGSDVQIRTSLHVARCTAPQSHQSQAHAIKHDWKGMCTHVKVVIRTMFRNIPTLCTASSTDEYQAHCKPSKHTQEYMYESTERPSP
jgi:hypothetical protein